MISLNECKYFYFFFFNDTATTEIYTLSLHDALPISRTKRMGIRRNGRRGITGGNHNAPCRMGPSFWRSEEHTSELQSRSDLVCRLLLEKKKKKETHSHKSKKKKTQHKTPQ